ncbi:MAG: hypothetical protein EXR75_16765, partial [Myxococcales bacterium]|nr:hypothetical protein [Myxococcales bacterium]
MPGPSASTESSRGTPSMALTRIGRYDVMRRLPGEAESYLAQATGGTPVVVRRIPANAESIGAAMRDISLCSSVVHATLVPLIECFATDDRLVTVSREENSRLTLAQLLTRQRARGDTLESAAAFYVAAQLAGALAHVHTLAHDDQLVSVCHGFLSPAWVQVAPDGGVYIEGLGLAAVALSPGLRGEPGYVAPEERGRAKSTPRGDVYSLCAIFWALTTREVPSAAPKLEDLAVNLPNSLRELLTRGFEPTVGKRRLTALELEHAFNEAGGARGRESFARAVAALHMRAGFRTQPQASVDDDVTPAPPSTPAPRSTPAPVSTQAPQARPGMPRVPMAARAFTPNASPRVDDPVTAPISARTPPIRSKQATILGGPEPRAREPAAPLAPRQASVVTPTPRGGIGAGQPLTHSHAAQSPSFHAETTPDSHPARAASSPSARVTRAAVTEVANPGAHRNAPTSAPRTATRVPTERPRTSWPTRTVAQPSSTAGVWGPKTQPQRKETLPFAAYSRGLPPTTAPAVTRPAGERPPSRTAAERARSAATLSERDSELAETLNRALDALLDDDSFFAATTPEVKPPHGAVAEPTLASEPSEDSPADDSHEQDASGTASTEDDCPPEDAPPEHASSNISAEDDSESDDSSFSVLLSDDWVSDDAATPDAPHDDPGSELSAPEDALSDLAREEDPDLEISSHDESPTDVALPDDSPPELARAEEPSLAASPAEEPLAEETGEEDPDLEISADDESPSDLALADESPPELALAEETALAASPAEEPLAEETALAASPAEEPLAEETSLPVTPLEEALAEETALAASPAEDALVEETGEEDLDLEISADDESPSDVALTDESPPELALVEETALAASPAEEPLAEEPSLPVTPLEEPLAEEPSLAVSPERGVAPSEPGSDYSAPEDLSWDLSSEDDSQAEDSEAQESASTADASAPEMQALEVSRPDDSPTAAALPGDSPPQDNRYEEPAWVVSVAEISRSELGSLEDSLADGAPSEDSSLAVSLGHEPVSDHAVLGFSAPEDLSWDLSSEDDTAADAPQADEPVSLAHAAKSDSAPSEDGSLAVSPECDPVTDELRSDYSAPEDRSWDLSSEDDAQAETPKAEEPS